MSDQPYRPSNSTEFDSFYAHFCKDCVHESKDSPCLIIMRTMCYQIDDEEYPEEWVYKDGRPTCTAFRHEKEGKPKYRSKDPNQKSIFTEE